MQNKKPKEYPKVIKNEANIFRATFETAPEGIFITNSAGKIWKYNQALCSILGYTLSELIGKHIKTIIPAFKNKYHEKFRKIQSDKGDISFQLKTSYDVSVLRKDGREVSVKATLVPFQSEGRQYVTGMIENLLERESIEKILLNQPRDLLETNRELEQFAYSTSHDLRSPLKTVQGFCEAVDEELRDGNVEIALTFNDQIRKGIDRLDKLTLNILEYTKARSKNEEMSLIDFKELMQDITLDSVVALSGNNIELKIKLNHSREFISQKVRIFQILSNLISNSYKYYDPNKKKPYVQVATKDLGKNKIEISVKDNGIGIPKDSHGKVFSMFFRGQSIDKSGTGLGLSLVKKHVDSLSGQIKFSSTPKGTCFKMAFPLRPF